MLPLLGIGKVVGEVLDEVLDERREHEQSWGVFIADDPAGAAGAFDLVALKLEGRRDGLSPLAWLRRRRLTAMAKSYRDEAVVLRERACAQKGGD